MLGEVPIEFTDTVPVDYVNSALEGKQPLSFAFGLGMPGQFFPDPNETVHDEETRSVRMSGRLLRFTTVLEFRKQGVDIPEDIGVPATVETVLPPAYDELPLLERALRRISEKRRARGKYVQLTIKTVITEPE